MARKLLDPTARNKALEDAAEALAPLEPPLGPDSLKWPDIQQVDDEDLAEIPARDRELGPVETAEIIDRWRGWELEEIADRLGITPKAADDVLRREQQRTRCEGLRVEARRNTQRQSGGNRPEVRPTLKA